MRFILALIVCFLFVASADAGPIRNLIQKRKQNSCVSSYSFQAASQSQTVVATNSCANGQCQLKSK